MESAGNAQVQLILLATDSIPNKCPNKPEKQVSMNNALDPQIDTQMECSH